MLEIPDYQNLLTVRNWDKETLISSVVYWGFSLIIAIIAIDLYFKFQKYGIVEIVDREGTHKHR